MSSIFVNLVAAGPSSDLNPLLSLTSFTSITSLTPGALAAAFAGMLGLAAACGTYAAVQLAGGRGTDTRVRARLRASKQVPTSIEVPSGFKQRVRRGLRDLGTALSKFFVDEDGDRKHALRRKLIRAGIYAPDAPRLLIASRLMLATGGVLGGWLLAVIFEADPMMFIAVGGGAGLMLPALWLRTRIKRNQKALETGLPDGLDLMVVCVEAGLTLDAAMKKVGDELSLAHPALARELSICHMETQIGLPRRQALKNLGVRTGFPPLQALMAMLIQADRFGTSIASALRIQAEGLRIKRQHRAEEAAAKASVKLTFPLVLFIFPASFIVLAGPTVLKMMSTGMFD
jgi:tight adherence protein C